MRENSEYPVAAEDVVGPREMSSLISESARVAPWSLFAAGVFAALAWFAADVAWLNATCAALATWLGLRGLWHALFLARAGLRFRDELDRTVQWIEREDGDA